MAALLVGVALFGATIYIPVFVLGVIGSSATNAGVVLNPLMMGWVVSSAITGQVITRTGRYRVWPITGTAFVLVGFWLLSRMGVSSTGLTAVRNMVIIGLGMGQMFQTYVLATQNAVARSDLGIATATIQFFRNIGATFGTAVFGTILIRRMASELAARLGARAASAVDLEGLAQGGAVGAASPRVGAAMRDSLASSLHTVFLAGTLLMALAMVVAFLLREIPLRNGLARLDPWRGGAGHRSCGRRDRPPGGPGCPGSSPGPAGTGRSGRGIAEVMTPRPALLQPPPSPVAVSDPSPPHLPDGISGRGRLPLPWPRLPT